MSGIKKLTPCMQACSLTRTKLTNSPGLHCDCRYIHSIENLLDQTVSVLGRLSCAMSVHRSSANLKPRYSFNSNWRMIWRHLTAADNGEWGRHKRQVRKSQVTGVELSIKANSKYDFVKYRKWQVWKWQRVEMQVQKCHE